VQNRRSKTTNIRLQTFVFCLQKGTLRVMLLDQMTEPAAKRHAGHSRSAFRELLLSPDPAELRRARWLTDTAAAEYGLDEDERFRFTFAANEAVANAIEHGAPSPEGHILVRTSLRGEDLVFEVQDWGRFAPSLGVAEALPERGRGLALMASMVDEVDVRPTGDATVVRLLMRGGSSAVAAA
jgi:anti-sigma regulatory factor (Ser/Thr protein kinase)